MFYIDTTIIIVWKFTYVYIWISFYTFILTKLKNRLGNKLI